MSYFKNIQITDPNSDIAWVSPYGELHTVIPIRLAGGVFTGSSQNPAFFTPATANGGSVAQSNGQIVLATNITANGSASLTSAQIGRFVGGTSNRFYARIYLGDTGAANNVRRWGLLNFAGTDGAYFKLSNTTLSVCTLKGSVETATTITPAITLTNLNLFQIDYNSGLIIFIINSQIVAVQTPTAPYANTTQFACFTDNTNSAGSTTNCSLSCLHLTIYRLGQIETQAIAGRVTTAGTYNLKYGPGTLHKITLNNPTGTLITVYDSVTGSGTTIAAINTPAQADPVTLVYDVQFSNGLTIVSTGTWDATVIYQ